MKAFNVDTNFNLPDPDHRITLDSSKVETIISSICNDVCIASVDWNKCHSFRRGRSPGNKIDCRIKNAEANLNKAKFLSLTHNIKKISLTETCRPIFLYLFYILCFAKRGEDIPTDIEILIKYRLKNDQELKIGQKTLMDYL